MHNIQIWDEQCIMWLNIHHTPFWDLIMRGFSSAVLWIPLYILLLYLFYKKQPKIFLFVLLALCVLMAASDAGSVHLFKNVFQRLRPCHNPDIADFLHLPAGCGGLYGFVSSHAANTFAIAGFSTLMLRNKYLFFRYGGMYIWSSLIGFSRVYLAVHYPTDVICGALLGVLVAYGVYKLYIILLKKYGYE